jgi:SAM-dependent methyltransferase
MEAESAAAVAVAAAAVFAGVWYYAVNHMSHDDDDEVYTAFFHPTASPVATPHAFVKILDKMPVGSRVLDLGVGSGVYLEHPPVIKLIKQRKLIVDGVDISAPNVDICKERIKKAGLEKQFTAICQDVRTLPAASDGQYDAILFMESFPVMSKALFLDIFVKVQRLLKPKTGVNYLYHNLGDEKKLGLATMVIGKVMKPTLKLLLGIDFGRLTTKREMDELVKAGAPGAPDYTDEILLAANGSEVNIDVKGVSNWYFWFWCVICVRLMKICGPRMEQHLITIKTGA